MSMRKIEGFTLATRAFRQVTAVDSDDIDGATFLATPSLKTLGAAALYIQAAHNLTGGTLTVRAVGYDGPLATDNPVWISPEVILNATALQSDILKEDGTTAGVDYFISELQIELPAGAKNVRLYVTALGTATEVQLYLGTTDAFTR